MCYQTLTHSNEYCHAHIVVLVQVIVNAFFTRLSTFGEMNKERGTYMCSLYNVISSLCDSRGITGSKMCAETGISKGLLTDLKMGRRTGVSAVTAQKIADYFGVTVGYLLGKEEKPTVTGEQKEIPDQPELTEEEKELLELFRTVPEEYQPLVLSKIRAAVELLGG